MPVTSKIWDVVQKTKNDVFFQLIPLRPQGKTSQEFLKNALMLLTFEKLVIRHERNSHTKTKFTRLHL